MYDSEGAFGFIANQLLLYNANNGFQYHRFTEKQGKHEEISDFSATPCCLLCSLFTFFTVKEWI